jgi:hypothetical protein
MALIEERDICPVVAVHEDSRPRFVCNGTRQPTVVYVLMGHQNSSDIFHGAATLSELATQQV